MKGTVDKWGWILDMPNKRFNSICNEIFVVFEGNAPLLTYNNIFYLSYESLESVFLLQVCIIFFELTADIILKILNEVLKFLELIKMMFPY